MIEEWRPAYGWEGYYEVSSEGRVRSVDRIDNHPNGPRRLSGRVLKQATGHSGHMAVMLSADGRKRHIRVHTLVAEAFICPRPKGLQCRHLDGNPKNNRPGNLKWGTAQDNADDRAAHGRTASGDAVTHNAKLTPDNIVMVRLRLAQGWRITDLARFYGVSLPTICDIKTGRTWAHV